MKRAFSFLFAAAILSACSGAGTALNSPTSIMPDSSIRNPQTLSTSSIIWKVQTGASSDFFALQDLDFYPAAITIDAGDSITYRIASGSGGDAHTVAFVPAGQPVPPPDDPSDLVPAGGTTVDGSHFVNSGLLLGGQLFTLHFPTPGTYKIYCLFHEPAMIMNVTVQRAGAYYPHTAEFYLEQGEHEEWADLTEAAHSLSLFPFANGGRTFAAGMDPGLVHFPPPDSTILRFINTSDLSKLPAEGSITIPVGTVLTWVNLTSNEPHTVTFARAGETDLPSIPPDPAVNVAPPGTITTYDGSKIVNSGTLVGPAPAPHNQFQLKFTKPGRYLYGCLYHDNSRMVGWVTVTP
jgi:plastocyanin